jgi:hypothetical protein
MCEQHSLESNYLVTYLATIPFSPLISTHLPNNTRLHYLDVKFDARSEFCIFKALNTLCHGDFFKTVSHNRLNASLRHQNRWACRLFPTLGHWPKLYHDLSSCGCKIVDWRPPFGETVSHSTYAANACARRYRPIVHPMPDILSRSNARLQDWFNRTSLNRLFGQILLRSLYGVISCNVAYPGRSGSIHMAEIHPGSGPTAAPSVYPCCEVCATT